MVVTRVVLTDLESNRLPNWIRGFMWPCDGKGKRRTCGDLVALCCSAIVMLGSKRRLNFELYIAGE